MNNEYVRDDLYKSLIETVIPRAINRAMSEEMIDLQQALYLEFADADFMPLSTRDELEPEFDNRADYVAHQLKSLGMPVPVEQEIDLKQIIDDAQAQINKQVSDVFDNIKAQEGIYSDVLRGVKIGAR